MQKIHDSLGFDLPGLRRSLRRNYVFLWGLCAVVLVYLMTAWMLKLPLLAPSAHDQYTLQAMHWRRGLNYLPDGADYPWLELAIYNGRYYVSFPPFPSVPMLLLSFLFGQSVPSTLVDFAMYLGGYILGCLIARRAGHGRNTSAAFAAFWVAGCNLLIITLYGGVWNIAQSMAFFLMMLFVWGMQKATRGSMMTGLAAIACAVGCRPFSAVYVPLGLYLLWKNLRQPGEPKLSWAQIRRMIPYVVIPACIALAYAGYNFARFGNPVEFGHTYLPEFQEAENGQFSTAYILKNLQNIVRLPWFNENQLQFPTAYGFAFYLVNPLFIIFAIRYIAALIRKRLHVEDILLLCCVLLNFFCLLLHKSFGAWQFGTRYLVDLLPVAGYFAIKQKTPIRLTEGALMLWGILFNAYGTVVFVRLSTGG